MRQKRKTKQNSRNQWQVSKERLLRWNKILETWLLLVLNRKYLTTLREKCQYSEFSGPYFSPFGLNTDQKNSQYGLFLGSVINRT